MCQPWEGGVLAFRVACALIVIVPLVGCTSASSGEWREAPIDGKAARLERAKAICEGRAAETQVFAGRAWIAGAVASNSTFRSCMAEHGFTQGG